MKTFTHPSEIKKGDWFWIGHIANGTRWKEKCVWNNPETQELESVWYLFGFLPCNSVTKYSSNELKNFKAMNS